MGVASALDRQVQFRRFVGVPDGFGGETKEWQDHGGLVWALRRDVKDEEAMRAGVFGSSLLTRFQVRYSPFTRDLTTEDRVECEGVTFEIIGIKEPATGQRRQLLEITGQTATGGST
ncbi:phage head closure protein [Aliiroseovarius sp. S2029]|uniref:phage head closure protein n=1 Tax=Aliiroseovarius sp. S2029 TaxID=2936988 RepID=UPI0020BDF146|nr:phage head closure protein [Aliiroseovarius sp. S2029]MCK8483952.1 phage head closure protein [Aliiroseovarius sp. S2029]